MKHVLSIMLALVMICSLAAQSNKAQNEDIRSLLKFEERNIDLGDVIRGDKPTGVFVFTNVSNEDVEIEFVSVCECTSIDWPKEVIKPGQTGEIPFEFDSMKKLKSGEVVLDILLKNEDPKSGYQVLEQARYKYNLLHQ